MKKTTTLHAGRVFTLNRDTVTLPNGRETNLDVIRHPGAAAMVCLTDKDEILLLKQYRHAAGGFIWEIPAGTLEKGEIPEECAAREIEEETGFKARQWEKLGHIIPVPGYSDEVIHIFLGTELTPSQQNLDQDEVLEVFSIPLDKAMEMAQDGTIYDAKTLAGLFWLQARRSM